MTGSSMEQFPRLKRRLTEHLRGCSEDRGRADDLLLKLSPASVHHFMHRLFAQTDQALT